MSARELLLLLGWFWLSVSLIAAILTALVMGPGMLVIFVYEIARGVIPLWPTGVLMIPFVVFWILGVLILFGRCVRLIERGRQYLERQGTAAQKEW